MRFQRLKEQRLRIPLEHDILGLKSAFNYGPDLDYLNVNKMHFVGLNSGAMRHETLDCYCANTKWYYINLKIHRRSN